MITNVWKTSDVPHCSLQMSNKHYHSKYGISIVSWKLTLSLFLQSVRNTSHLWHIKQNGNLRAK